MGFEIEINGDTRRKDQQMGSLALKVKFLMFQT
jgi:hypothetical protein